MSGQSKLLKWAGSKSQISDRLSPFLRFDVPYIEPFCGSAVFFFENSPETSHLNDLNSDLIGFFRQTKSAPDEVWEQYAAIPVDEQSYYSARTRYNEMEQSPEKAGHFIYLNHFCFNGLYRTNRNGKFNTPYGAKLKVKKKLDCEAFRRFSGVLQNAQLHSLDFEDFLLQLNPTGSCIYMDPPYFTNDERVFGEYGANTFKGHDLERLFSVSHALSGKNRVVISYKNCSEFSEKFCGSIVGEISVTRNVGGFAGRRKVEKELVAVLDNQ
ncbi:Dam family site-specific DNA-(adenine-N6)-methyltransferase [Pseudosulfitobacter sp. DSM 107133]|uniref:DNA adenine methylase n=1 Tax=Pseudosulfitobacter sp. DSM 107133 TaxID=2883100 RepID=UPI000DF1D095|nr:Dam family site-specific DNA-(adenine-N6)-methyltransferase [Pseudosulfitobacter sp. DSM 107133]UOA27122.1 Modification methylase DpnIIA [Pseudosulfitobacter sp. DSM 107133]